MQMGYRHVLKIGGEGGQPAVEKGTIYLGLGVFSGGVWNMEEGSMRRTDLRLIINH